LFYRPKTYDKFVVENKGCVLQFPSAVTFGEFNFLINSNHQDFAGIKILEVVDFPFDRRNFG